MSPGGARQAAYSGNIIWANSSSDVASVSGNHRRGERRGEAGAVCWQCRADFSHPILQHADDYEVDAYRRDRVVLESGVAAWVYVDASSPPGPNPVRGRDQCWRVFTR
ncbi:hypothetical protein FCJ57_12005 [Burkholderia diffusa]|nr:hypothetical protein [Burkholderia diffusa]